MVRPFVVIVPIKHRRGGRRQKQSFFGYRHFLPPIVGDPIRCAYRRVNGRLAEPPSIQFTQLVTDDAVQMQRDLSRIQGIFRREELTSALEEFSESTLCMLTRSLG